MPQQAPEAWAAGGGLAWAARTQAGGPPAALDAWGSPRRTRCNGQPSARCLARPTGPLGSAWRQAHQRRGASLIHHLTHGT